MCSSGSTRCVPRQCQGQAMAPRRCCSRSQARSFLGLTSVCRLKAVPPRVRCSHTASLQAREAEGLKSCSIASHRRAGRAVRDQWHAAVSRGKAGRLHVSRGADGGKRVGLLADAGQVCGKARSTFPRHDGARTRSSFSALATDICSSSSTSCSLTRPSPVRTLSVSPTCLQARLSTCMT